MSPFRLSTPVKTAFAGAFIASMIFPAASNAAGPAALGRDLQRNMSFLSEGTRSLAPFAHVRFCLNWPDQCTDNDGPALMMMDAAKRTELRNVNAYFNRTIRPVPDPPGQDSWNVDVTEGDCDDYAVTKRKRLAELGWPAASLRIAVTRTASGEGHAVLVVRTSDGDLVLDNRSNTIRNWRQTDLQWIKIHSGSKPRLWFNLDRRGSAPVEVGSNAANAYPAVKAP